MDEFDYLNAPFGPNARKIIDSNPPEYDELFQAWWREVSAWRGSLPAGELAAREKFGDEDFAALLHTSHEDWRALEDEIIETEREILRERGIEPD